MSRVSAAEVRIIKDSSATDPEYESFIDTASLVVDSLVVDYPSLSSPIQAQIEKYYAAHLIEQTCTSVESQSFGKGTGFKLAQQDPNKYLNLANQVSGGLLEPHLNKAIKRPVFVVA